MNLNKFKITKNELASIKGATSTTMYQEVGISDGIEPRCENEYEDVDGDGTLSEEEYKQEPQHMGCG